MKRLFSVTAVLVCAGLNQANPAHSASATAALDINSAYVWRGLTFNDGFVLQPSMDVSEGGFAFNVWGNFDLDDYDGAVDDGEFSEVDLTISYAKSFGPIEVSGGAIEYLFPGGAAATTELFGGLSYDIGFGLSASTTFYYDIDQVDDFYASAGIDYGYTLMDKIEFGVGGSIGYAGEDFAAAYAGGTDGGLFNYVLTGSVGYSILESLSVSASLTYTDSLDSDVLPDESVDATFFGGVNVSYSF